MDWESERQWRQHGEIGRSGAVGPRKPKVVIGAGGGHFANATAQRRAIEGVSMLEHVTGMPPEAHEEKSQLECIITFANRDLPVPERFHELAWSRGINIEGS